MKRKSREQKGRRRGPHDSAARWVVALLALVSVATSGEERQDLEAPQQSLARGSERRAGRAGPAALEEALDRHAKGLDGRIAERALQTFTVGSAADPACDFNDIQGAIDAAAANGPALDFIRVASNQAYNDTALFVDAQDLAIFGGYDDCTTNVPTGTTLLRGSSGSVLDLAGRIGEVFGVTLRHLDIRNGNDTYGGGVHVHNGMRLDLDATRVSFNDATFGGGVAVRSQAELYLFPDTLLTDNDAINGGGIYCQGATVEVAYRASIHVNEALGFGGGIYASGCSISSRAGRVGLFQLGIDRNEAVESGGGIYALGSSIELRGTAESTALLSRNIAERSGGGAFLAAGSSMVALNASIVDNQAIGASSGGGVSLHGSALFMDRLSGDGCAEGDRCSQLSGNSAGSFAAVLEAADSTVEIRQTYVEGNTTPGTLLGFYGNSTAFLEGVVLASNDLYSVFDRSAIRVHGSSFVRFAFLTVWGNMDAAGETLITSGPAASNTVEVQLVSSIIDESTGSVLGVYPASSSLTLDCLLVHEDASIAAYGFTTVEVGDPLLVDPANGDFHLQPGSPAIDYCDNLIYSPVDDDIDGEARGTDSPEPDNLGPYDLGADEAESVPSLIFRDGFESGDTAAWSPTVP